LCPGSAWNSGRNRRESLSSCYWKAKYELLLEGEIDVAMVGDVQDIPARIDEWPLFEERYVVVLVPTHQLANLPAIGIDELRETTVLERADCDVVSKIHGLYFPEQEPQMGHRSGHEHHLQHMAAAGFGVILEPEHMPRLPSLKAIPIQGDLVRRAVRLLAVRGRRYSPALDAFVKVARLWDWALETNSSVGQDILAGRKWRVQSREIKSTTDSLQATDWLSSGSRLTSHETAETLDKICTEPFAAFGSTDWESTHHLVGWLRDTDVAAHALKAGDTAPDFLLPDAEGRLHSSERLRRGGPLVVSFFCGGWCPFCTAELRALQAAKDEFERHSASLVIVTPETWDFPRRLKKSLDFDLKVLSDVDYGVAISYGVLFRVPKETREHYSKLGFDLGARHGSSVWMLPIPATYIIDTEGRIRSAFVEPDFTIRAEPAQILESLRLVAQKE